MASIYIHIPFCERKCIYCDFCSVESHQLINPFLNALRREIESSDKKAEKVETIYIGGGTPSVLHSHQIEQILDSVRRNFMIEHEAEITIEVNPGTVDLEKLSLYRLLGINRLSVGVQSFHEPDLKFLTRIHSVKQSIQTIEAARKVGFDNLSIDMIYAVPTQTISSWKKNLELAAAFMPEHISAYSLIVEDGTPLARMIEAKEVNPLSNDLEAAMYEETMEYLQAHDYEHYEVSNYAIAGYRSRHNSNYWNHSNYLGFGPAAHSFWKNHRWWNVADVPLYCEKILNNRSAEEGEENLTKEELLEEAIMLGLRGGELDLQSLISTYDFDIAVRAKQVFQELAAEKLAIVDGQTIKLTNKGFLVCDEISEKILRHCL